MLDLIVSALILVGVTVLGLIAFLRNRHSQINVIFSAFVFSAAFWIFTNLAVDISKTESSIFLWSQLTIVGVIFFPLFFWKFSLLFPRSIPHNKWLERFFWVAGLCLLVLVPTRLNIKSVSIYPGTIPVIETGGLYILFLVYFISLILLGFFNLLKKYKKSTYLDRQQLIYVILGLVISLLWGATTNLFLLILGHSEFSRFGSLSVSIFILFATIAIVKHRLLDIRLFIFRTITFGTIIILITAIFVSLSILLGSRLEQLIGVQSDLIIGLLVGFIITLTYQPIRKIIERSTNRFLFKKSYDPDRLIAAITEITSSVLTLGRLLEQVSKNLSETLHPGTIGFVLLNKNKKLEVMYAQGIEKAKAQQLARGQEKTMVQEFAKSDGKTLVIDELISRFEAGEYQPTSKELLLGLQEFDIDLVVPLYVKEKLRGVITLGSKKSGDLYTQQDISTLEIIAGQTAVAVENAQLYDELRELNIGLERKVAERTSELRNANAQLRELDKTKSEFISIASHQLRTPLTVIKGYISMMREGSFGKIRPQIMTNLEKMYASNERLIELVENLLDISRIESGRQKFEWDTIDMGEMAKTVVEELTNNAKNKGLRLTLDLPKSLPKVYADKNKLHEVMMNFTDNAVKYTPSGSVAVSVSAQPAGMITFAVQDTGMGVNPESLPHLFQKFSRGKGSFQVHTEGTGLGLYVARMIVEAHHGVIGVETKGEGKGSKFFFSLPLEGPKTKNYMLQEPIVRLVA